MTLKQVIIDVREPSEYESGHVEGALNIPASDLTAGTLLLDDLDKDTRLIAYCRTGTRADASIQIFKQMGFTNVLNGINARHTEKNYLNINSAAEMPS